MQTSCILDFQTNLFAIITIKLNFTIKPQIILRYSLHLGHHTHSCTSNHNILQLKPTKNINNGFISRCTKHSFNQEKTHTLSHHA